MDSSNEWDVFCSYCWGPQRRNQAKVKEIREYLMSELGITAWLDIVEMQAGELSRKIYEGIAQSKIIIIFLTPEYLDSKNCINEICLSNKMGKNMIYYISEDLSGNIRELIPKKMPKEVYRDDLVFLNERSQLLNAVKETLKTVKSTNIKTNGKVNVFVSYHNSANDEIATKIVKELKPLFNADFDMNHKDSDKYDKMKNCDAFLVIVNNEYCNSQNLKDEYSDLLQYTKPLIRLNLEPNLRFNDENKENIKVFDFFNDIDKTYLFGEGQVFVDLVFELERKLPKTLTQEEKHLDLVIIASQDHKKYIENHNIVSRHKYVHPSTIINPNFSAVRDSKVILAVIDDELTSSQKSILELKFAELIGTQIITIEEPFNSGASINLKRTIFSLNKEKKFYGIDNIKSDNFMEDIFNEIDKEIKRNSKDKELLEEYFGNETVRIFSNKMFKPINNIYYNF